MSGAAPPRIQREPIVTPLPLARWAAHQVGQLAGVVVAGGVECDDEVGCRVLERLLERQALVRPCALIVGVDDRHRELVPIPGGDAVAAISAPPTGLTKTTSRSTPSAASSLAAAASSDMTPAIDDGVAAPTKIAVPCMRHEPKTLCRVIYGRTPWADRSCS